MVHDIFISYSSQNTEYAEAVCERLENNGIEFVEKSLEIIVDTIQKHFPDSDRQAVIKLIK